MSPTDALRKAIDAWPDAPGNISAVARTLDTDAPTIHGWLKGHKINPSFCVPIAVISGAVEPHQLRDDVFPAPGSTLPEHPNKDKGRGYRYAGGH